MASKIIAQIIIQGTAIFSRAFVAAYTQALQSRSPAKRYALDTRNRSPSIYAQNFKISCEKHFSSIFRSWFLMFWYVNWAYDNLPSFFVFYQRTGMMRHFLNLRLLKTRLPYSLRCQSRRHSAQYREDYQAQDANRWSTEDFGFRGP